MLSLRTYRATHIVPISVLKSQSSIIKQTSRDNPFTSRCGGIVRCREWRIFFTTWVAEFKPTVGSSTGQFANVIDGSIIVTAVSDSFIPSVSTDIPYSWSGPPGWLQFVPEPSSAILLASAFVGMWSCSGSSRCPETQAERSALKVD